ncbi:MAG: GNAT family N-acetyltransferase [Candidatus Bathyarchaeia archaeon]|jgi:L-amino acid N-acyltransferase YncA
MATGRITVRNAGVGDYSLCLPLLTLLYHGDIGTDFKKTFESFTTDNSMVLLAQSRREVVGILIGSCQMDIDWEGKTARIDAIVVSEKHRRTGVGKQLASRFVTLAQMQRCKAVKSRVNRKNEEVQRFHESLGFARADTYEYVLDFPHKGLT